MTGSMTALREVSGEDIFLKLLRITSESEDGAILFTVPKRDPGGTF
jgi:hypothetical protein